MKKLLVLFLSIIMLCAVTGCTSSEKKITDEEELILGKWNGIQMDIGGSQAFTLEEGNVAFVFNEDKTCVVLISGNSEDGSFEWHYTETIDGLRRYEATNIADKTKTMLMLYSEESDALYAITSEDTGILCMR